MYGWLQQSLSNVRRLKVGGLQEVLVRRRVQIIEDIVATTGLQVNLIWEATSDNLADELTRVPSSWLASRAQDELSAIAASVVGSTVSVGGDLPRTGSR